VLSSGRGSFGRAARPHRATSSLSSSPAYAQASACAGAARCYASPFRIRARCSWIKDRTEFGELVSRRDVEHAQDFFPLGDGQREVVGDGVEGAFDVEGRAVEAGVAGRWASLRISLSGTSIPATSTEQTFRGEQSPSHSQRWTRDRAPARSARPAQDARGDPHALGSRRARVPRAVDVIFKSVIREGAGVQMLPGSRGR